MNREVDIRVERLISESQIKDVIYRYCRGIDRRDWSLMDSVFHEGATDNHGVYVGSALGFSEFTRPRHEHITMCMHHIANIIVEFKDDATALTESYCTGIHRYAPTGTDAIGKIIGATQIAPGAGVELTMWVRYLDVITKRGGVWKISDRKVIWEGMRVAEIPANGPQLSDAWICSQRNPSDAVYRAQAEHGLRKS